MPACGLASRARAASGIMSAGITAGARGASAGLGQARGGNAAAGRVPGNLARSRVRIKPGESRGGAPRGERARSRWFCVSGLSVARFRARGAGGWQHPFCVARTPYPCVCRRSASPHFFGGERIVELLCACKLRRDRAARTSACIRPRDSGGGGPLELAQRANRGGGGACGAASLSLQVDRGRRVFCFLFARK